MGLVCTADIASWIRTGQRRLWLGFLVENHAVDLCLPDLHELIRLPCDRRFAVSARIFRRLEDEIDPVVAFTQVIAVLAASQFRRLWLVSPNRARSRVLLNDGANQRIGEV